MQPCEILIQIARLLLLLPAGNRDGWGTPEERKRMALQRAVFIMNDFAPGVHVEVEADALERLASRNLGSGTLDEPADVEDVAGLDFGAAIDLLKLGRRVRRAGWNGKGMWLAITEGQLLAKDVHHFRGAAHVYAEAEGVEVIRIGSHIDMRAADGTLVIGWLASQTDMLAEDWEVVPE